MHKKIHLLLSVIIIIGFLLRFYQLGDVPIGFHKDEAFLGYNGYSILETGKDMNGNFLPIHLQSFLYSPAGYSYTSIPFIKIFGLSAFSVRFASMFFGVLTIPLVFFIVRRLFEHYKYKIHLGLISTFFLAISPWHITLSRTATENTVVVFFISVAALLYLKWITQQKFLLLLFSFASFGSTFAIYQAPRAFLPFFIPLLILTTSNIKIIKKHLKILLFLYIVVIVIPLISILTSKDLSLRIKTVSVFATEQTQMVINEQLREDGVTNTPHLISRVFHNKIVGYTGQIAQNYFNHFSYNFLFTDNVLPKRYVIPGQSLLYGFELLFILFGIYALTRINKNAAFFILGWALIAPVGSALTFDDIPNLQRTLIVFPSLSIISACGMIYLWMYLQKKILFIPTVIIFGLLFVFSFTYFLHHYFIHSNVHVTIYRSEGYKDLVHEVNKLLPKYSKAVITDRESSPTIFFLLFSPYSPKQFQKDTKTPIIPDFDRISFGKYEFTQEECPVKQQINPNGSITITGEKAVLYVNSGLCKEIPGTKTYKHIKRPDNSTAFTILSIQ